MTRQGEDSIREIKLCMLGETQVGKTSLVVRFSKNKFNAFSEPTIGASFMTKRMMFNGSQLKYNIWDTAGQERFKGIANLYYRGAAAVIIVYDITSELSFKKVEFWANEVKRHGTENSIVVVVGNKLDLEVQREVPAERGKEFADAIQASFFEVSAKTSENVEEIFHEISRLLPPVVDGPRNPNYGLPPDMNAENSGKGCC